MRWSVHRGLCGSCQRRLHRALPSNQPVGPPCPINEDREDRHLDLVLFRSMRVGKSDCDQFTINRQMTAYAPMGAIGWRCLVMCVNGPSFVQIRSIHQILQGFAFILYKQSQEIAQTRIPATILLQIGNVPLWKRCLPRQYLLCLSRHSRRTPRGRAFHPGSITSRTATNLRCKGVRHSTVLLTTAFDVFGSVERPPFK